MRSRSAVGLAFALAIFAAPLLAQSQKVAAEALFEEGRKLVAAGKADEACPKFAESQRIDPSIGTLLNLGNCYELTGRLASAWATYKEAVSAATAQGRKDLLPVAEKRAEKVTPRLSKLTIKAEPTEGLEVKKDGEIIERGQLGVAIPTDGGQHTISAAAAHHKPFTTSITLGKEGDAQTVTIPRLEPLPVEAPPPASTSAAPPASSTASPPPRSPTPGSTGGGGEGASSGRRTTALVVAGVGAAGLLASTAIVFLVAKPKYNDSLDHCRESDKDLCDPKGKDLRDAARRAGNLATVVGGLGAMALVTGGVLYFSGSNAKKDAGRVHVGPTVGQGGGGAIVWGSF